jgi:hypothetical protein
MATQMDERESDRKEVEEGTDVHGTRLSNVCTELHDVQEDKLPTLTDLGALDKSKLPLVQL